jgi:hypothetical protein
VIAVVGNRQCGKTEALANRCIADKDGLLIVSNEAMAWLATKRFPRLSGRIFTGEQVAQGALRGSFKKLYIDDFIASLNLGEVEYMVIGGFAQSTDEVIVPGTDWYAKSDSTNTGVVPRISR